MKNARKYALIVAVVAALSLIAGGTYVFMQLHAPTVRISGKTFKADYRRTEAERQKGLSGRANYSANRVMVFEFDTSAQHCFWMKDMKFNIDMVWLDGSKHVTALEENVSPSSFPQEYCHDGQYVLEFTAGTARGSNIYVGDQVIF